MGFFQKFKNALYNAEAYVTFLKQGLGKGILYLFILTLIFGGIVSVKIAYEFNKAMVQIEDVAGEKIPDFRIQNGKLSVDAAMPIVYKNSDVIIVVDTENTIDPSQLDEYEQGVLIGEAEMYAKKSTGQIQMIKFNEMQNAEITGTDISEFLTGFKGIGIVIIMIGGILCYFIGKLLSVFIIMGVGGLIVGQLIKCRTDYETSCKLGAYALTLPMLIKLILSLIGIQIPYFFIIYYGIALIYVGRALKAIAMERGISEEIGFKE